MRHANLLANEREVIWQSPAIKVSRESLKQRDIPPKGFVQPGNMNLHFVKKSF
jgi:hypothetical protein